MPCERSSLNFILGSVMMVGLKIIHISSEHYTTGIFEKGYSYLCRISHFRHTSISSAKCILVTGSLWECLRVVRPESQGGQIQEFTGPMQWPSGAPGRTWKRWPWLWKSRLQAWEHLGVPATSLGAPMTSLWARRITVEQSGKNVIFFGNAAGAPGYQSFYLSFNC